MYEFFILSQLMHGSAHGYLIAKIINDMIGPYARISYGRLYPLLAKLEQGGLIEVDSGGQEGEREQHEQDGHRGIPGDRNLRIYRITDAGRLRFHFLMSDTSSNPGDYQKLFEHKIAAFAYISPSERLRLIDHYITYCQAHVFHMQAEAIDLVRKVAEMEDLHRDAPHIARGFPRMDSASLEYIVKMMQHLIDRWEHEIEWVRSLRAEEAARMEQAQNSAGIAIEKSGTNHIQ